MRVVDEEQLAVDLSIPVVYDLNGAVVVGLLVLGAHSIAKDAQVNIKILLVVVGFWLAAFTLGVAVVVAA